MNVEISDKALVEFLLANEPLWPVIEAYARQVIIRDLEKREQSLWDELCNGTGMRTSVGIVPQSI